MMGRPRIVKSPKKFEELTEEYFAEEDAPTITGLALYLGFADRQSLYDYQKREEFSGIVKRARLRVEHAYEKRLGASNPTGAIFALKQMGWSDSRKIEHTGKDGEPLQVSVIGG